MDKAIEELFESQSKVIAALALRAAVLEKLLLEKKIVTTAEITKETQDLAREFVAKTQEALQKAVEKGKI